MHTAGSELDNAALTEVRRNFHALPDEFEFKPSTVKLGAIGVFCRQTLGKGKREMRCLMCSGYDCIDPPACRLDVDNKFCVYALSTAYAAILLLIIIAISHNLHSYLMYIFCVGSRLGPYQGKEVTGVEEGSNTEGLWEV